MANGREGRRPEDDDERDAGDRPLPVIELLRTTFNAQDVVDAQRLIADARSVVNHCISVGRMPAPRLQFALLAFKQTARSEDLAAALTELQSALAEALTAIAPVTLHHLRKRWDPNRHLKGLPRLAQIAWQGVFVAFFVALIMVAAATTSWFKEGNKLVRRADALNVKGADDAYFGIGTIIWDLSTTAGEARRDPTDLRLSQQVIREKFETIRLYQKEANEVHNAIKLHLDAGYWGAVINLFSPRPHQSLFERGETAEASGGGSTPVDAAIRDEYKKRLQVDLEEASKAALPIRPNEYPGSDGINCRYIAEELKSGRPPTLLVHHDVSQFAQSMWNLMLTAGLDKADATKGIGASGSSEFLTIARRFPQIAEQLAIGFVIEDTYRQRLRCGANITRSDAEIRGVEPATQLKNLLEVLGLWGLPAIYGALGSVMFLLRIVLNRELPDPPVLSAVQRIVVGAFAGIAVAWFLGPADNDNVRIAEVSITVLTIAFLVGYAVDLFFTLLARWITILRGMIERIGANQIPPPDPSPPHLPRPAPATPTQPQGQG